MFKSILEIILGKFSVIHINGGLGNQLFQYAMGRKFSLENDVDLYLDLMEFERKKKKSRKGPSGRDFNLSKFRIVAEPCDRVVLTRTLFPANKFGKKALKLRERHSSYRRRLVLENVSEGLPNLENAALPLYLSGYFQNYRVPFAIREHLLEELSLKEQFAPSGAHLARIQNEQSVSVHIRRGDYLTSNLPDEFGVLSVDYYLSAMELVRQRLEKPSFFVFCEDVDWAQDVLGGFSDVTIMDPQAPEHDMAIMSYCRHQIIANSSFSWWGAFLNRNPGQIVIGPSTWFRNGSIPIDVILHPNWIRHMPENGRLFT